MTDSDLGLGPPDVARLAQAQAAIEAASAAADSLNLHLPHRRTPRLHESTTSSVDQSTSMHADQTPLGSAMHPLSSDEPLHVEGRHRHSSSAAHASSRGDHPDHRNLRPVPAGEALDMSHQPSSSSSEPLSIAPPAIGRHHHHAGPPASLPTPSWERNLPGWLTSRMELLRRQDGNLKSSRTVSRLKQVLETFTDVTRYPR